MAQFRTIGTGFGSAVGRVFNPRSGDTRFIVEVINNSTSCFPFGTRVFGAWLCLVAPLFSKMLLGVVSKMYEGVVICNVDFTKIIFM